MMKSKQIFKKLGVFDGSFLINLVERAKAFFFKGSFMKNVKETLN